MEQTLIKKAIAVGIVVVMLVAVFVGVVNANLEEKSMITAVSTTAQEQKHQDPKILIYVLSTRNDSWEDSTYWWYTGPKDLDSLAALFDSKGYTILVEDKVSLPYINISKMLEFDQVWIIESDSDAKLEISDSEAQDLQQFYEKGGRIWISMESTPNWAEDAIIFAEKFGVVDAPVVYSLSKYEDKYKPVYSEHPLFINMSGILFDDGVGALSILSPDIQTVWRYPSTAGPTPGVAILDGTPYNKGRVVFDSGWVLGGTFNNSAVKQWGIDHAGEFPISQDLQFALNVAAWLQPISSIFDTGLGAYPSIMGTHKGEIKPSRDINVSKLYTYACAGTGGHTESIKLYENDTLIASGTWNGYQDDWHNITITPSVILQAGHTYNYTTVMGSYPQIIHATSKEVTGGTITCTSFVDANGKTYPDWIPAIRLE